MRRKNKVAMVDCAVDSFGRLDVIFNNAGVGGAIGPIRELEEAEWDYTFAAVFLASADSAFVSGQELVVDGGLTALGPDMWQRTGIPREATLTKSYLTKGTTGEPSTARKL